ncbi:hypothetical protein [Nocardia stercoris]|uniref:Uncharacterized protein n=1 Tax=Nocardia stercoris TaxID=2483361 RepID=A0A3M2KYL0_9NOCA|nr:hypothetical protein [Nocardia stercoris]RMI29540.1 hypothetical protein EBN03_26080 [Nocardia stercoris]
MGTVESTAEKRPALPSVPPVLRRLADRAGDAKLRRRVRWTALILFALFVFPGIIGVVATAQNGSTLVDGSTTGTGSSEIDGLSWMNVRDSSGVPLANYQFVASHGGIFSPWTTVLWTLLSLEFVGYIVIVISAIWLIGYALSFQWLGYFGTALNGVAKAFTGQIATPIMLLTAATIGAFFVAWFWLRGYHAKATTQVATMLMVAILGPLFLAEPLADVLSADGLLAQGRNVGIAVAAGLNGDSSPNPNQLVATMQGSLADNFARTPLQVWNFGHVVDTAPACRAAWSAGIMADDDGQVKNGLRSCGDAAAKAHVDNPSMGQVATGLILLICSTVLLVFAAYLAVKIIKCALDAIYHAFGTIIGFAAGGFIYGAPQTGLIRNLVHTVISAGRMVLFTVFLGVYMLFIGNLFKQAQGHVMPVIVISGTVEVIAISQLKHLSASLTRGNDWVANRIALAVQNGMAKSGTGGGGGGGTAIGMGTMGASGSMSSKGMIARMALLNTFNANPVTAWLAGGVINPLNPLARGRTRMDRHNIGIAPMNHETHMWNQEGRANWLLKALARADGKGGMGTALGVANALDGLGDSKVPDAYVAGVLRAGKAKHQSVIDAQRALAVQNASVSKSLDGFLPQQKAIASAFAVQNHLRDGDPLGAFAAQASVAADNFRRHSALPTNPNKINHRFVERVMAAAHSDSAVAAIKPSEWRAAGRDTRLHIRNTLAVQHQAFAKEYAEAVEDPAKAHLIEETRHKLILSATKLDHLDAPLTTAGSPPWRR